MTWAGLLVLGVGSWALKFAGVWLGDRALKGPLRAPVVLLPAALFGALIAVQTLTTGASFDIDARVIGVALAAVAVWRRAPFVIVILVAMAATAGARALGLN